MKKIILSAAMLLSASTIYAQWTSNSTNIYNNNTGSVGIGTTTPLSKLHVDNGAITVSGNNPYGGPMIMFGPAGTNTNSWGIENTALGLNFWRPYNQPNAGNYFLFLKHSNGNIGIRTENPTAGLTVNSNVLIGDPATPLPSGYRLYVQTGILTERIKVAVKGSPFWADFVFDDNYQMPSLPDLESYIRQHKHLPDIPSAKEVTQDGIDLAEMDARLLQKIEELTLYVIKLEKELNTIKQKQLPCKR